MRLPILVAALLLAAPAARAQTVTVEHPWARATAEHAETGAAYATITAGTSDRLTGASTPAAASVQVHEIIHDNGIVRMREVDGGLALEPGKPVTLAPGSYHLMLIGLKQQLKPGASFPITLSFANEPAVTVTVPVNAAGASAAPLDHTHVHSP
jgi:copper(I)-binding protein